jgi:class 3 adenylate cyclase
VPLVNSLPSGTVTFLFSDIEGSTRLTRELRDDWGAVLADHRRLLREAFDERGGREVDMQGDAFFFAFPRSRAAVEAAVAGQRALSEHDWPQSVELRVRMGLHTGEPSVGAEGYLGLDVVRAARLCATAQGGQVLISSTTRALLGPDLPDGVELRDLGEHPLKDLEYSEHVFQVVAPGIREDFAPLTTAARPTPAPFAGLERQLAVEGRAAAMDLSAAIQAHVAERLREKGITVSSEKGITVPTDRRRNPPPELSTGTLLFAAFVVVVVAVAVVAVLYLLFG